MLFSGHLLGPLGLLSFLEHTFSDFHCIAPFVYIYSSWAMSSHIASQAMHFMLQVVQMYHISSFAQRV